MLIKPTSLRLKWSAKIADTHTSTHKKQSSKSIANNTQ